MQQPGARYGIWGVPASTERMAPTVSPFEHALTSARGVNDLFGQYYKNKLEGANANFRQGEVKEQQATMPDKISAMNTKNQTDTQLYPQMQQAKLQQEQQTIKEIMARTGLSHAQAKVAMAHLPLLSAQTQHAKMMANPIADIESAYKAYQKAPAGSPEKALYQAHITSMIAGKGGGSSSPIMGSALSQLFPGMNVPQSMVKNPAFGSQRSGAGGTYTDPSTGQTISTPTNANTTQNQRSIQALQRVTPLVQDLSKKMSQFQTLPAKGKLTYERLGNLFGGNNELPNQYAQGRQDLELAPESLLKAYGLNVTDKSLETMRKAVEPVVGESQKGYQNRISRTLGLLQENEEQAKSAQSGGYDVTPGQGQPQQQQSQGLSGDDIDRLSQETGMSREEVIAKLRGARGR